ncbi:threonine-phosphate decarboxylase CobD [Candidatus Magnetaquicoccus inordinatus]|uniref:threonine-phosphate decarboxylase CobD n=1 Tax=Candidatus Magnetaquicoccus inordinatus TaxID=2496818 RepID=UPI00102C9515|nr:threonine-phosphate decarboxylase CobD [Candidatus Magnetaquicoccus inordinatus]
MLEHGGGLRRAAEQFAIPPAEWLDLSTGINPHAWSAEKSLPKECWMRLPEEEDGLEEAARLYYQCEELLPLAGTQQAISLLPRLLPAPRTVAVLSPTYGEHAHCWAMAGHYVQQVSLPELLATIERFAVVIVVNPNNPTGTVLPIAQLLEWRQRLHEQGGWLLVDEAFMDVTPAASLAPYSSLPGLIVLRSVGKFFALAGARCGFVLAEGSLLAALRLLAGPWCVSGPSRWMVSQALRDQHWITQQRQLLPQASHKLATLLQHCQLPASGGTALFQWVPTPMAALYWHMLAQQGVLVRHFSQWSALRFALPGTEQNHMRLEKTLQQIHEHLSPFSACQESPHVTP